MTKILIVDDSMFLRESLKKILRKHDFDIVGEAENGLEAIDLYKVLKPDIVTMDLTMPQLNGLEALKGIHKFDINARVVMISAMGQEPMVIECIQNGAKGFIVKPFKEEHLVNILLNCINKKE